MEKRLIDFERQIQAIHKASTTEIDQIKSIVNMNLSQKVDYRDLDEVSHQLHTKVDIDKVQDLVSQLRNEVLSQLATIKKDAQSKIKKKEEDAKKKKQEVDFATDKVFEEIKIIKDKMQKLATQFDKELSERDKQIKAFQNMSQGDIQKAFT